MFGTSGIRGRIGEAVTGDLALQVGRAVASMDADCIVIGRDPRESGDLLADALANGARECGADVVDLGLAATPTLGGAKGYGERDRTVLRCAHDPRPSSSINKASP